MEDVHAYEEGLYAYLDENAYDVLQAIRETGKLDPETEEKLKAALSGFVAVFLKKQ